MSSLTTLQRCSSKELGYPPLWEDTPVTLQVALVGTDGIVLASDKKTVVPGDGFASRRSSITSKILVNFDQGIAIAYADYDASETVAKSIWSDAAKVKQSRKDRLAFESFALDLCNRDQFRPYGWHGELLIISLDDLDHLLHLSLKESRARLNIVENRFLAGDSSNPAGFFVEAYYANCSRRPIAELTFLAAHVILSGGRYNPAGIGGLEVVRCTTEGFEWLSDSLISEIAKRSDELDAIIRRDIFIPLR